MFCKYCGNEITQDDNFCSSCGNKLKDDLINQYDNTDSMSIGWGILGFFIPVAGLVLFLVWQNSKPNSAKAAGIGALIGLIVSVICYIALLFLFFIFFIYNLSYYSVLI